MSYQKSLKNNIKKIYLFQILAGIFFSVPVIVLFWQDNGLSLTEIMILQSIFAIMTATLEIPTGYFADIHGRKKTLILASFSMLLGITFYSFGYNFLQFLIAEFFFALGSSLISGTKSAFVFDTLKDLKKEKQFKKIWGNILFVGLFTLALSGIIGSFIAKINLRYTLFASIPFFALLIPVSLSLKEPKRHKIIIKESYRKELIKIMQFTLIKNKKLRWLILYSGIIFAFNQSALWLYQPYFKITGLKITYFGLVFASFQIVSALSSKYAYKLEKKLGQKYSLGVLIFLLSTSYFLMSNFIFLFSFSFCFIQQFIRGFRNTVITDYINRLVDSDIRATTLSVENFTGKLIYATILPLIGYIADIYTLQQAFSILGITTLFIGLIMLMLLKREKIT